MHALRAVLASALLLAPAAQTARADEPALVLEARDGRLLSPGRDVLGVSRHVSNDSDLAEGVAASAGPDPELFRLRLRGGSDRDTAYAELTSESPQGTPRALLRYVPLRAEGASPDAVSPWLRLVSDSTDARAPAMEPQLLRVQLRDWVRARVQHGRHTREVAARVGGIAEHDGERRVLEARLRLVVLRYAPGAAAVLGHDDASAIELARRQVEIANEIWAQCFIDFGTPEGTPAAVVDPPSPALLAIGDEDGLPARGGGRIAFTANGVAIDTLTVAGDRPRETARRLAKALTKKGFTAQISVNPRAENGAGESADVVVRTRAGAPVTMAPRGTTPLSSDARQRVAIGRVSLDDGIQQFDNMVAAAGTLEERTLIKLLSDADPTTIDVFFINRFAAPERQGEAFIESDGSTMANALVLDRNAVRFERQAWVQAHELGHVLLDEPFHPDNFGWDRPSLLMDSDARAGRVTGPKRLRDDDCRKARRRSLGPGPVLLVPRAD
jgi:hypothetical protein